MAFFTGFLFLIKVKIKQLLNRSFYIFLYLYGMVLFFCLPKEMKQLIKFKNHSLTLLGINKKTLSTPQTKV